MTNGLDKLIKFWPVVLTAGILIIAATEVRMAVAENEKDIEAVQKRQQRVEDALTKQVGVNERIDERTVIILDAIERLDRRLNRQASGYSQ